MRVPVLALLRTLPRTLLVASAFASAFMLPACSRGPSAPSPVVAARPEPVAPSPPPRRAPDSPRPKYIGALDPTVTQADLDSLWYHQLMVPVEGVLRKALRDDFTARRSRENNGGLHAALDIPAPRSTPVVATDDMVIGRLVTGPVGGIALYATDPSNRFVYYYAHLERYRRGLAVGDRVAKGSIIGYVGTTGNAPPNAPHLHFQVMKRVAGRAWWDGPPVNPYFILALDGRR
ncbi:MAG TPA: M23 family metallopeptidase [Gemmatimonas sp.]|nr:M23 family metallopeptidase [Gemmatimonas sp.]